MIQFILHIKNKAYQIRSSGVLSLCFALCFVLSGCLGQAGFKNPINNDHKQSHAVHSQHSQHKQINSNIVCGVYPPSQTELSCTCKKCGQHSNPTCLCNGCNHKAGYPCVCKKCGHLADCTPTCKKNCASICNTAPSSCKECHHKTQNQQSVPIAFQKSLAKDAAEIIFHSWKIEYMIPVVNTSLLQDEFGKELIYSLRQKGFRIFETKTKPLIGVYPMSWSYTALDSSHFRVTLYFLDLSLTRSFVAKSPSSVRGIGAWKQSKITTSPQKIIKP